MCFLPQMSVVFNSLSGAMSCPQLIRLYRNNKTDIRKHITVWGLFFPITAANLLAFTQTWCFLLLPPHFCSTKKMHLLACIYQGRLSAGCHQSTVPVTPGTAGQGLYCNSFSEEEPPMCASASPAALPLSTATLVIKSPASTQLSNSFKESPEQE